MRGNNTTTVQTCQYVLINVGYQLRREYDVCQLFRADLISIFHRTACLRYIFMYPLNSL